MHKHCIPYFPYIPYHCNQKGYLFPFMLLMRYNMTNRTLIYVHDFSYLILSIQYKPNNATTKMKIPKKKKSRAAYSATLDSNWSELLRTLRRCFFSNTITAYHTKYGMSSILQTSSRKCTDFHSNEIPEPVGSSLSFFFFSFQTGTSVPLYKDNAFCV